MQHETLARGRTDAVVVREAYVARRHARTLPAEEAASQVELQRVGPESPRRAEGFGAFSLGGILGEGQFGASAELFGQFDSIEVLDGLLPVAAQHPYFR